MVSSGQLDPGEVSRATNISNKHFPRNVRPSRQDRIPDLFTELVIITHSYKAHYKLLILSREKKHINARKACEGGKGGREREIMISNRRENIARISVVWF